MHPTLNIAIKAARSAGNIIVRSLDQRDTLSVSTKGRNDFVTEVDKNAEKEIIKIIRKAFPSHGILAEESGSHEGDEFLWLIDPLDGTTNFLHGFPQFAVSIALQHKGRLEHGVIYDPLRQEIFSASRGAGAQLNERRIRVSQANGLEGSLLGTGFPFRQMDHLNNYIEILKNIIPQAAGVRRPGSAALDLAYVACGRLDGFWEFGLKPWDLAAGALIIQEAGGMLSDFEGGSDFMKTGNVVAGNAKVMKALLQTIHRFNK
jgi:myo-inositol-1(or 4)-monophosphatase